MLGRLIEHALVSGLCLGLYACVARRNARKKVKSKGNVENIMAAVKAAQKQTGPSSVLTNWGHVELAPPETMPMEEVPDGQAVSHTDGRGSIYKFKVHEGVTVNMYFTKQGNRRSGDVHDCTQYDVVLSGTARLRTIDGHTGQETVVTLGPMDYVAIPARTPHLFEFTSDCCLLEWWDAPFKAWYFRPYRRIIEQQLPLEATLDMDFSLLPPSSQPLAKI